LLDDRHDQALGGVHGHADVVVAVVDHLRAVLGDGRVEHGVVLQRLRGGLDEEGHVGQLDAALAELSLEGLAQLLHAVEGDLLAVRQVRDL
jgi:hypothetical protein